MLFYRQCTLRAQNTEQVAWIEERGARVGFRVTLKDTEDPQQLWTVMTVSNHRLSKEDVNRNEHRHTSWHQQVDI